MSAFAYPYAGVRPQSNVRAARRPSTLPYGLRQEAAVKQGLAREFQVIASPDLDFLQKLDCVVRDPRRRDLPPVGLQITARSTDTEKMLTTLSALRRTRAVSRAIYLIAETEIRESVFPLLFQLIRGAAAMDRDAMVVARLAAGISGPSLRISGMFALSGNIGPAAAGLKGDHR